MTEATQDISTTTDGLKQPRLLESFQTKRSWRGPYQRKGCGNGIKGLQEDCVFCISKCPKCGSTDIEYQMAIMFSCRNTEKNQIEIVAYVDSDASETKCNECDHWFGSDEMERIGLTLMRAYDISPATVFKHNEDGRITEKGYRPVTISPGEGLIKD